MRMTFAQRGMYLEMLLEQWENFDLPDSADECAELIGGSVEEWRENWPVVRARFLTDEKTGRIKNTRLEKARKDLNAFKRIARKGGLSRAKSATRRQDGTYVPADHPAGEPAGNQPLASTATASATATASPSTSLFSEVGEPTAGAERAQVEDVVRLWNEIVTAPIPRVEKLTADRRRAISARLKTHPALATWRTVITWLNGQDWCRAPGHGEHKDWTATIDWLCKSDGNIQRQLERATAGVARRPAASVDDLTLRRNAAKYSR